MAKSIASVVFVLVLSVVILSVQAGPKVTKDDSCLCATTDDLLYVCGTDGKTYNNLSELECEKKCGRSEVKVARPGKCEADD